MTDGGRATGAEGTRAVAVVMTCHNRREATSACLRALREQLADGVRLSLFVTDDGSTDETSEAILALWPEATILVGSGSLYWAAGMALAEQSAVASDPDFLLWLNDDTNLKSGALQELLNLSAELPGSIIVGAAEDPDTGELTYGGRLRIDYHPQRFRRLPVSPAPQWADTFHGNVVLVPMAVRRRVGPIDGSFPHAYADDDYGLRATALGVPVFQAPGTVATCRRDEVAAQPTNASSAVRWRQAPGTEGAAVAGPSAVPPPTRRLALAVHPGRWPIAASSGQGAMTPSGSAAAGPRAPLVARAPHA